MVASNSEARRLIQQGAVEVDGSRVTDPNQKSLAPGRESLLQVGKRQFKRFLSLEKEWLDRPEGHPYYHSLPILRG